MKLLTRIICLLLTVSCVACAFIACGQSSDGKETGSQTETKKETKETETELNFIPDTLTTQDFDGYVFTILHVNEDPKCISIEGDLTGDIIQDALYNSESVVSERFHVEFERINGGGDVEHASRVKNLVTSGDENAFSISVGHDCLTMTNAMAGYYASLTGREEFNFEKPWWPKMSLDAISVNHKIFVASSYLTYTPLANASCVIFNKGMMNDLGLEYPYDNVFEGEWYLYDMYQLAEKGFRDPDNDGTIDPTLGEAYGLVMGSEAGYVFQRSVNVVSISKDEDDLPFYSLDANKAYDFLDLLEGMLEYGKFDTSTTGWESKLFGEGSAFLLYDRLHVAYNNLRYYGDITYGFLPAPKLDEEQTTFISGGTDILWGIPTTSISKLHEIATIAEALSCQNYNYVLPTFYESTMKTKLSDSEDDVRVLDIIRDTVALSFSYFFADSFGGLQISMADLPRSTKAGSLSSFISSNQGALETKIQNLISKFEILGEAS